MHVGGKRRGKGQRLLYFFRTPPGVRVGRAPIDEAAIRLLEQHNPDVEFDWTRILKDPPQTDAPPRRDGRDPREREPRDGRGRDRDRSAQRSRGMEAPPAPASWPRDVPSSQAAEPDDSLATLEADDVEPAEFLETGGSDSTGPFQPAEPLEPVEPPGAAELAEAGPFEPTDEDRASASFARIGAEGLGRLRARYAEVMARIAERPLDELAREELKLRAERLNPDAWVTADEVTAALEQYETVFEGLRAVVGRYPRRRRRTRK
jgi:hypothetical protein